MIKKNKNVDFFSKYEEFTGDYNGGDSITLKLLANEDSGTYIEKILDVLFHATYKIFSDHNAILDVCEHVSKSVQRDPTPLVFADICNASEFTNIMKNGSLIHSIKHIPTGRWYSCPKLEFYDAHEKKICSLEPFPEDAEKNGYLIGIVGKHGIPVFDKIYNYLVRDAKKWFKLDTEEVQHPSLDKLSTYFSLV